MVGAAWRANKRFEADLEKRVRDHFHRLEVLNGGMEELAGLAESTPLNEVHAVLEAAFSEADSETSLQDEKTNSRSSWEGSGFAQTL